MKIRKYISLKAFTYNTFGVPKFIRTEKTYSIPLKTYRLFQIFGAAQDFLHAASECKCHNKRYRYTIESWNSFRKDRKIASKESSRDTLFTTYKKKKKFIATVGSFYLYMHLFIE